MMEIQKQFQGFPFLFLEFVEFVFIKTTLILDPILIPYGMFQYM